MPKHLFHKEPFKGRYLTIYTDGSFCHRRRVGGIGVYMRDENGHTHYSAEIRKCPTSTDAEYYAAVYALELAEERLKELGNTRIVVLVTDLDMLMIDLNRMVNNDKSKDYIYRKNPKVLRALKDGIGKIHPSRLTVKGVKAHSMKDGNRSWANDKADRLAKEAMNAARKHVDNKNK